MMPHRETLVALYSRLSDISDCMLSAAQGKDWSALAACGQQYCECLEVLRISDRSTPLQGGERAQWHRHLLHILDNDARLRRLIDPSLARLEDLMAHSAIHLDELHNHAPAEPAA